MTRYLIQSDDLLIFRDGRPFGDFDRFGGTCLSWPLPQTLAGMCRTAIGHQRGVQNKSDYFSNPQNAEAVKQIGIEFIETCLTTDSGTEALLPTPADLLFIKEAEEVRLLPLAYTPLKPGEGSDIGWEEWLYPMVEAKSKPTTPPRYLRKESAAQYLNGGIMPEGQAVDFFQDVVSGPVEDVRIHTAINPATGAASEGQLYAEAGFHLSAVSEGTVDKGNGGDLGGYGSARQGELGIHFSLCGLEDEESLPGWAYLGGERRRVSIERNVRLQGLECPDFSGESFVKLVLTTPGDFGGWVPSWLHPGEMDREPGWRKEPLSEVEVKLRSAVVQGWEPVSGWDYAKRGPKAFRKLVRPGSVYLLEVKKGHKAEDLAKALWGKSICDDKSSARDGYGQVVFAIARVGNGKKETR